MSSPPCNHPPPRPRGRDTIYCPPSTPNPAKAPMPWEEARCACIDSASIGNGPLLCGRAPMEALIMKGFTYGPKRLGFPLEKYQNSKGVFVQKLQPLRAGRELRNYMSNSLIILGMGETFAHGCTVSEWLVKSLSRVRLFCDPIDCSPPGSSVHGIFQARLLQWVAISFSRESSQPKDRTWVFRIAGRRFTI